MVENQTKKEENHYNPKKQISITTKETLAIFQYCKSPSSEAKQISLINATVITAFYRCTNPNRGKFPKPINGQ